MPKNITQDFISAGSQVIFGKEQQFRLALCSVLARGHILIEDPPGMGKTTFVKVLAKLLGLDMSRIQFTNDLLPADILGTNIYRSQTEDFVFKKGPIFSQIILGDELNRASPRTQSAFLQAMEEGIVSVEGITYELPNPFLIIATQNPMDQSGVFPLPESQLDRFLICLSMGYPDSSNELELLKNGDTNQNLKSLQSITNEAEILQWQKNVQEVKASDDLLAYVLNLVQKSRLRNEAEGFSPRAGLSLVAAAKAWAYLEQRDYVLPEDIKTLAPYVLAHRMGANSSRTDANKYIEELLATTEIP